MEVPSWFTPNGILYLAATDPHGLDDHLIYRPLKECPYYRENKKGRKEQTLVY